MNSSGYKIPDEKITEVTEATDIVDLISGYVKLQKKGKNFFGLCPFHTEKTPSFKVDPVRQLYYCFGCHKGGNAITFLMDYEKLSFIEVVEQLAEKANISLPRMKADDAHAKERESLYFANKFAAKFYYDTLMSAAGAKALDYMHKRGFDDAVIRKFGIGYSPPLWDGLMKHAQRKSVSFEVLFKAGLLIRKDGGGYYDRFRGRVMIPIINLSKKVVGFGGRILVDDKKSPKYINSPETLVYQKSNLLFGLFLTREAIRNESHAIFVEGYTDLISLYKSGVHNVVATSGTALTTGQAQLIKRYADYVVLIYDSDAAGTAAAMRGADIFLNAGLELKIAELPRGHDPDSFIVERGVDAFKRLVGNAQSFIQFKIKKMSEGHQLDDTSQRARIIQSLLESISLIKDRIRKSLALKEVAEHFMLDERVLSDQLKTLKPQSYRERDEGNKAPEPVVRKKSRYDLAEENILRNVLEDPELIQYVIESLDLSDIQSPAIKQLLGLIFERHRKGEKTGADAVINLTTEPVLIRLLSDITSMQLDEKSRARLLNDCIISVKVRPIEERLHQLLSVIKKDSTHSKALMQEYDTLKRELVALRSKSFVPVD
jgi:DNA primase